MISTIPSWDGGKAARSSLLWRCLTVIGVFAAQGRAQPIPIDDFNDLDADGWTNTDFTAEQPWGPALIDVNGKGEFRFSSGDPITFSDPYAGTLLSTWDVSSSDPSFSDGLFRGRVRIGETFNDAGLLMRFSGTRETGFFGYIFKIDSHSGIGTLEEPGKLQIWRIENTSITEQATDLLFPIPVDKDLMLEAGAIGDQLSLKVWPLESLEPEAPQLTWTDSAISTGALGVHAQINGRVYQAEVDVVFDDLVFTPVSSAEVSVPEPGGLAVALVAVSFATLFGRRRKNANRRARESGASPTRAQLHVVAGACLLATFLAALLTTARAASAQAVFNLGTLSANLDPSTGMVEVPVPDGTYNAYTLQTDWRSGAGSWSNEAVFALTDGPIDVPTTTYYTNPGSAPNGVADTEPVRLTWEGFLDIPIHGPMEMVLLPLSTFGSSRWDNTVLEFSFQTPPSLPTLLADLGIVASEFSPINVATFGDLDTELAVYSPTSQIVARNDDAPGPHVFSEIEFDNGLPAGDYIAAISSFNTTFDHAYQIKPGDAGGDYGLNVAGNLFEGTLAASEVAYVGFSIGSVFLAGDYNGNGQVEQGDLDLVLLNWGGDTIPAAWTNNPPEGAVDQQELDAVLLNWGSGAPLRTGSVPEPSGLLIALAIIAFGYNTKRCPMMRSRLVHAT